MHIFMIYSNIKSTATAPPCSPPPLPLGIIVVSDHLKATELQTYSGLRSGVVLVRIQISLWYTGHTECRGWSDSQMVLLSSSFLVNWWHRATLGIFPKLSLSIMHLTNTGKEVHLDLVNAGSKLSGPWYLTVLQDPGVISIKLIFQQSISVLIINLIWGFTDWT